jgi:hypothetical protein
MDIIGTGIIAGFIATLTLSAILDPMATVARTADVLPPTFGWLLHFFVGSFVWGAAFASIHPLLRGPSWLRGIIFGAGAWLFVMVAVMPLTQAGLFGWSLGWGTPAVMLCVHLLYGVILGTVYGLLLPEEESEDDDVHHGDHLHPVAR